VEEVDKKTYRHQEGSLMKVLQITNKPPWPPVEGGPMAMYAVSQAMIRQGFRVKILAASTSKFNVQAEDVPDPFRENTEFETVFIDTRVKYLPAFLHLFKSTSYHISRFQSKAYGSRLKEVIRCFAPDVVLMESLFMLPYLPLIRSLAPATPVVLRAHNVEHLIWERMAAGEGNPFRRRYLRHLAGRLKRAEEEGVSGFDGFIPISEIDMQWFRRIAPEKPSAAIPFGIFSEAGSGPEPSVLPVKLYHLGSMDWYPNMEAVRWLIQQCDAGFLDRFPDVELHLAGRRMPEGFLMRRRERLNIQGEVPDSQAFIRDKHALVAPIFSGSGIRIKILEAMSMGKVVITTSIGAEGIRCTHKKDILIADDRESFLASVEYLLNNPGEFSRIGDEARRLILQHHHPDVLADELCSFLRSFVDR